MKSIKTMLIITALLLGFVQQSSSQETKDDNKSKIIATALDYGDGFLSGSGERMFKALYPDLNKLAVMKLPKMETSVFVQSTYSSLIEMSAAQVGVIDKELRKIKVQVLDVFGGIAAAKLTSSQFDDYLNLVNVDGHWQIANVLWAPGPDSRNRASVPVLDFEKEKPLIEKTVKQYFEGVFTGQADLVSEALAVRFSQASWNKLPQTGRSYLARDGGDLMIGIAKAKLSIVEPERWDFSQEVLDFMDGMATVKISVANQINYFQMANVDGVWKIVNGLRTANISK